MDVVVLARNFTAASGAERSCVRVNPNRTQMLRASGIQILLSTR